MINILNQKTNSSVSYVTARLFWQLT